VYYLLKVDNKRLTETCMRSEFENEMLALELVNDRIKLKGKLHEVCQTNKIVLYFVRKYSRRKIELNI
jgi:hypothetical protein